MEENSNVLENYGESNGNSEDGRNVTNVLNTTVNNNTFTTTIACIDYMWKNSKIIMLVGAGLIMVCIVLSILFAMSVYKINTINSNSDERYVLINNKTEGLEASISVLSENTDVAITKSTDAINRVTECEKVIQELVENKNNSVVSDGNPSNIEKENVAEVTSSVAPPSSTNLYNMKMVSSRGAECKRIANNTLGDEIKEVVYLYGSEDAHVTYYLGNKYTKLKVKVCCPDEERITEAIYPMIIYANNDESKELFSMDFGRNIAVTPLEIDVTGVEFITFKVNKYSVLYDKCGMIIFESELE